MPAVQFRWFPTHNPASCKEIQSTSLQFVLISVSGPELTEMKSLPPWRVMSIQFRYLVASKSPQFVVKKWQMLVLLLSLCASESVSVPTLTAPEFRDHVLKRAEGSVWLVLFTGLNTKACHKAEREFRKAATQASSLCRFAIVNLTQEPFLQRKLQIEAVPLCRVFHAGGTEDYVGKMTSSAFLNLATDKLPNYVRTFDRKWLGESIPSIVLFTDQIKVPSLWASLSVKFKDQLARFGICSEFHIHREMGVSRLPTVIFFNSSGQVRYRGEMKEEDISAAISAFIEGKLQESGSGDDDGFYRLGEFDEQCRGRDFCVVYTGSELSDEYKRVRGTCRRHPMKFLYGSGEAPVSGMRSGVYYIWNPRREAVIEVEDVENLPAAIDRVIGGGASWKKIGGEL